jgi:nickel/cobalt exporter
MDQSLNVILLTAASIAFIHTLLGPDHYLPFIVMAKARNWTMLKTSIITILCGLGHVGSSIVLGLVGVALGIGMTKLTALESFRGNLAAWAFMIFGFTYCIWGLWRAIRRKPHTHNHLHLNGHVHIHDHTHNYDHVHLHEHDHFHSKERKDYINLTPWILFTIFVLGPCEPMIPLVMYPAARGSTYGVIMVSLIFSVITIFTMLSIVLMTYFGLRLLPMGKLERYTHAIAGATIGLSGCAIVFLGL